MLLEIGKYPQIISINMANKYCYVFEEKAESQKIVTILIFIVLGENQATKHQITSLVLIV